MEEESPQMPRAQAAVLSVAFAVVICFGGITNALVLATHIKYRKRMLKESKDILIFSLAIGDLIMTSLVCPLAFSSAVVMKWTTGKLGCTFYAFFTTWIGLSSMLQLALNALERHHTLSNPKANRTSVKRTILAIVSCWVIAFVASCLPLSGLSEYTFEGFGLHCSIVWSTDTRNYAWYCLTLLVFFYAIPVVAISICYAKMFLVVRRIFRNATEMWGAEAQSTRKSYMAQVKFTKQLLVVTGGFLFAWTPYAVMSMLRAFTDLQVPVGAFELPALFSKTSNIYNPIIYFFMYKRLRRNSLQMLYTFRKALFPK